MHNIINIKTKLLILVGKELRGVPYSKWEYGIYKNIIIDVESIIWKWKLWVNEKQDKIKIMKRGIWKLKYINNKW